eukprot:6249967-Amphidinium_carterae.1
MVATVILPWNYSTALVLNGYIHFFAFWLKTTVTTRSCSNRAFVTYFLSCHQPGQACGLRLGWVGGTYVASVQRTLSLLVSTLTSFAVEASMGAFVVVVTSRSGPNQSKQLSGVNAK